MTSAAFLPSIQTAADGTSFVTLPAMLCSAVHVLNLTGTALSFKRGSAAEAFVLPASAGYTFRGITNANQLAVKRTDESATRVTLNSMEAEYESC